MRRIFIVGSTGALGREAIEVISILGEEYKVVGITGFNSVTLLKEQAEKLNPQYIGIRKKFINNIKETFPEKYVFDVRDNLSKAIMDASPDVTLFLSSNITALKAIDALLKNKKYVAIANKESIITGGEILFSDKNRKYVIPIDSEMSALFQCIANEEKSTIKRFIITASGGPFWKRDKSTFDKITVREALHHPNWQMGKKITIDSATLINKAFEVMEAHFLFNIDYEKIDVTVHRQSIVHSLVEFIDGNIKAVLSVPLMYFPLQYAITYPRRMETAFPALNLEEIGELTFQKIDKKKFPGFSITLQYGMKGGNFLPSLIAVDEVLVREFLEERIHFSDISRFLDIIMQHITYRKVNSIDELVELYNSAIIISREILRRSLK